MLVAESLSAKYYKPEVLSSHIEIVHEQNKVMEKTKIRNRYNQLPHLTRDNIWESDNTQEYITHKRAKRSALSQQVS